MGPYVVEPIRLRRCWVACVGALSRLACSVCLFGVLGLEAGREWRVRIVHSIMLSSSLLSVFVVMFPYAFEVLLPAENRSNEFV